MTRQLLSTLAVALMAVTACAGDGIPRGASPWQPPATPTSDDERWPGQVATEAGTGDLTAPGFNSFIDSTAPSWAASPESATVELLRMGEWDGPVEAYLAVDPRDAGETALTVLLTQLGDDSVAARRYRVVFAVGDDGLVRLVSGEWSQRCHPGRGHRRLAPHNCV